MGATGLLSKKTGHQIGHVRGVTHHVAKHYIVGQLESSRYAGNDEKLARLDYRVVVVDNYLIFYKISGKTVHIYRIVHGARDVPGLLSD